MSLLKNPTKSQMVNYSMLTKCTCWCKLCVLLIFCRYVFSILGGFDVGRVKGQAMAHDICSSHRLFQRVKGPDILLLRRSVFKFIIYSESCFRLSAVTCINYLLKYLFKVFSGNKKVEIINLSKEPAKRKLITPEQLRNIKWVLIIALKSATYFACKLFNTPATIFGEMSWVEKTKRSNAKINGSLTAWKNFWCITHNINDFTP